MPRHARPARHARRKARRAVRRSRIPRGIRSPPQMAKIVEVVEFSDLRPNETTSFNFALYQFARASTLAANFKFYRASKVEWIVDPTFNTFQESGSSGPFSPGIPYFYSRMNRNQEAFNYSAQNLQAMGARPRKLTKQIRLTYKPNWCSPGVSSYVSGNLAYGSGTANFLLNQQMQGHKVEYGWLSSPGLQPPDYTGTKSQTQNLVGQLPAVGPTPGERAGMTSDLVNYTTYNGNDIYIDQLNANVQFVARVVCVVHWEFKDPNFQQEQLPRVSGAPIPITATSAPLAPLPTATDA